MQPLQRQRQMLLPFSKYESVKNWFYRRDRVCIACKGAGVELVHGPKPQWTAIGQAYLYENVPYCTVVCRDCGQKWAEPY